jgi:hypothetical protein
MNNEWRRIWKEMAMASSRYWLKGLQKITKKSAISFGGVSVENPTEYSPDKSLNCYQ